MTSEVVGDTAGNPIQDTFAKYMSQEATDYLLTHEIALGGEERIITTLVLGVDDYDTMIEGRRSGEVAELLCRYYESTVPSILRNRGRIDKFIEGAGILATFGTPTPLPHAELAAVRAARSLRLAILRFNKQPGNPVFSHRIAITTGEVTIGNIGNKDRLEYTVVGAPVTLAFRMKDLARDLKTHILIDENTWKAVDDQVRVREPHLVTSKIYNQPSALFPVIG